VSPTSSEASVFERQFDAVVAALPSLVGPGFEWALEFRAEASDFVRFNHALVRQAGQVRRALATLRLCQDSRHSAQQIALSGELSEDRARVAAALESLVQRMPGLAPDPFGRLETRPVRSRRVERGLGGALAAGPSLGQALTGEAARTLVHDVLTQARGSDLVGLLASGPRARGVANSHGVLHWHEVDGFTLDFSLHHLGRAAKASMHGRDWSAERFAAQFERLQVDHQRLERPACAVQTGRVRAFLAPPAVDALLGLAAWGGFAASDRRSRRSPLQRLVDREVELSPRVTLWDDVRSSDAPAFNADGFERAAPLPLIEHGRDVGACCNTRTAIEFGLEQTGADGEQPEALHMASGELAQEDVLRVLGTGLYVNRLWYLNWSDRQSARSTGMTRFATWWVENGVVRGPVEPVRFDDSLFQMLGANLEALTRDRETIADDSTYDERSLRTACVPGLLINDWRLVS